MHNLSFKDYRITHQYAKQFFDQTLLSSISPRGYYSKYRRAIPAEKLASA